MAIQPLLLREVAHAKVRAIGTCGFQTAWAAIDVDVALLERFRWKQKITCRLHQPRDGPKRLCHVGKTFVTVKIRPARLQATSNGICQVKINRRVVGDESLTPGWQSYKHRLHYQTHVVTPYLVEGEPIIAAYAAKGWYVGRSDRPGISNMWVD